MVIGGGVDGNDHGGIDEVKVMIMFVILVVIMVKNSQEEPWLVQIKLTGPPDEDGDDGGDDDDGGDKLHGYVDIGHLQEMWMMMMLFLYP